MIRSSTQSLVGPCWIMKEILKRIERFDLAFLDEIAAAYQNCENVTNISSWYKRLNQLTLAIERGDGNYRQVEDHVFELKIINHLIDTFPRCKITYEPKGILDNGKDCDIEVSYQDRRYLIEVKCFHPEWKEAKIPEQHIAENNKVIMDGVSYHTYQATRGHLIDVTRHTEQKLENYNGELISVLAVQDGFYIDIEDFRDFVFLYKNGSPRPDDPLGPMTVHNLREPFKGIIDQFWAFPFPQESFNLEVDTEPTIVAPLMHQDRKVEL